MDTAERIVVQPDLMLGQPCIRGTRLPVYVVVEAIATGASQQELMVEYPFLESEDIAAALVVDGLVVLTRKGVRRHRFG